MVEPQVYKSYVWLIYFIDYLPLENYSLPMIKDNQKSIAKKSEVTPSFLSQILSGNKRPSWKTAKRLAEATNTEPALWMEGTPDEIRAAVFEAA